MTEKMHTLELTDEELHFLTAFFWNGLQHNDVKQAFDAGALGNYEHFFEVLKKELSYSDYLKFENNVNIAHVLLSKLGYGYDGENKNEL